MQGNNNHPCKFAKYKLMNVEYQTYRVIFLRSTTPETNINLTISNRILAITSEIKNSDYNE